MQLPRWPLFAAASLAAAPACAEVFFDFGANATRIESKIANIDEKIVDEESGLHVAVGVRRAVNPRTDFGARLELDMLGSTQLLAVRALDFRRHRSDRLAFSAFLGAARLDLATPAYGYYLGGGVQLKQLLGRFDLGVDLRFGDDVARDNLLPTDPQGGSPDNFHDVIGVSVYLSYRF